MNKAEQGNLRKGKLMDIVKSGFTLPGETGYEKLMMELAEKWGADAIRDSDGTELSEDILDSGYDIYSTICIIRGHNEWARSNMDKLQQTFLITSPRTAESGEICIPIMEEFFEEQFCVNDTADALRYWQVYDRTEGKEVPRHKWRYNAENRSVVIEHIAPWHNYTVSFLTWRVWEEISMYNHTTNGWDKEHLMPLDPRYPETQKYLLEWLDDWCRAHPHTSIVRFTSMFYNFVWIWGSDKNNRSLFTDWASYDFTVSPAALDEFKRMYGYRLTAEDFVHQGKYHVTHMPAGRKKLDWMAFVNDFVISFGKKLIDIVHSYGKKAYMFYDDSWVGTEPYNSRFKEFGFDGIIKCVFSGFEARLCSGVPAKIHELRLHPYLFPTGVNGSPSFSEGGHPEKEAMDYWKPVRRALLREPVDRIGLGGYLHLLENAPEFIECITRITDEFHVLKQMHKQGAPYVVRPRVAVLHYWGRLRSWTLSGHFHETYMHDLIHVNESLSGLPFDVSFISFDDIKEDKLDRYDVIINAGTAGSAWSGGACWNDKKVIENITKWVYGGGTFIGINEPSAVSGCDTFFRMAHVLGVDEDTGDRVCHGKWKNREKQMLTLKNRDAVSVECLLPTGCAVGNCREIYLTSPETAVLRYENDIPAVTVSAFGDGMGIYLASYRHTPENMRMLMNLILYGSGESLKQEGITDNLYVECAYYPANNKVVFINNSDEPQTASVTIGGKTITCRIESCGLYIENV